MKHLLRTPFFSACAIAFILSSARSQQTNSAGAATPNAFEARVQQLISNYPNGEHLYRLCDVFARKIDMEAARELGIHSRSSDESTLSELLDTVDDITITTDDDDEPSIAINHKNPNLIVAGANDIFFSGGEPGGGMLTQSMPAYLSTDAGHSWKTYRLPKSDDSGTVAYGDPMIVSDDSGTFYYAFLLDAIGFDGISDLMVAHSTDGKNWTLGTPVVGNTTDNIGALEDKPTIAIDRDPTSPHAGRLYIAWTEFNLDSAYHYVSYSDDKGETWSAPNNYTYTYGYFALLRVGQHGTVFIASIGYAEGSNNSEGTHGMTVSTDGGQTFTDHPMATFINFPLVESIERDGLKGESGGNGFRATPYPCFDLDNNNKIYGVYGTYDDNNYDAALWETTSTNLGSSWTTPVQIGSLGNENYTPMNNDHYMPWVTVDPITSQAYISMSSSEEDTILNVKARSVICEFQNPNTLEHLGSRLFNTLAVTASGHDFLGDYAISEAYNGYYAASWTENRPVNNENGNIFAYVSSSISSSITDGVTSAINSEALDAAVSPNPVTAGTVTFTITSNDALPASIRLFDLRGVQVLQMQQAINPDGPNSVALDIHAFPAGVYYVRISNGYAEIDKNFVVLR